MNAIDDLLDNEGFTEACDGCKFLSMQTQSHPYGSTTASETLAECLCDDDSKCPRLIK